ncbi:MAG: hypothetical protein ACD_43C00205G0004 [uncultured bacterium]|nr:MAG: hypothetical protein ACD_43C00205G0004 [uncultured bacterium]
MSPERESHHELMRPDLRAEQIRSSGTLDVPTQSIDRPADQVVVPNVRERMRRTTDEEAEQTAFFHQTLDLMDKLDHAATRELLILNVQLWITGGHTASAEWYKKIGQRLQEYIFTEDLPDLTEEQRAALTEFMGKGQLVFGPRPQNHGKARRHGWMRNFFRNQ